MLPSGYLQAIHRLTEPQAPLPLPSFSRCLFHNLTWLVFLSLPSHLFVPPLPPDLPLPIDCDLTAIMHPPVGQLKLSYRPEWRGGRVRKKREEIMMPDLFVQLAASFELAPLEVGEATVLAILTAFQCHR